MAGFQFGHISTFSFKGNTANFSIDEIAAEAARQAGSHPHVAEPLPPTLLAGDFSPELVPNEIRRRITEAKTALKGARTVDGKVQRIREDTHVLEAQVHSHPIYTKAPPPEHQGEDRPSMDDPVWKDRYLVWRTELVRWVKQDADRRGLDMLCVVEHLDEAHPHIHAFLVPRPTQQNPRMDAKVTHPGYAAQARSRAQARERLAPAVGIIPAMAEGGPAERIRTRRRRGSDIGRRRSAPGKEGKARRAANEPANLEQIINQAGTRAYKAAMREWQDRLYDTHSFRHGLARVGPGLERLGRRAWWQRQKNSEAVLDKKELVTTLTTVADNRAREALVADEQRRDAQADVASLQAKIEELNAELVAANETIRRAEELPLVVQSLEVAEKGARERLDNLSAGVAEADRKLRLADEADVARKKAEDAAAEAESRRQEAERAVESLEQREALVIVQLEKIGQREAAVKEQEKNVMAKLRGMAAWASGRLDLDADGRLAIVEPKPGRNPGDELANLQPVEIWLVKAVKNLDSLLSSRHARALHEVKGVVASTIRAWSEGLIYRTTEHQHGLGLREHKNPNAVEKFQEDTSDHKDVVYSTLPLLPDLAAVHDVLKRAEENSTILDAAEKRHLNNTTAALQRLNGQGAGR